MPKTVQQMPKSVALDFEEFFDEEMGRLHDPMYTQFFDATTVSQLTDKYSTIAGAGLPEEVASSANAPEDEDQEGYTWEIGLKTFKKKKSLTYLLRHVDQSGLQNIENYAKDIAKKAVVNRDVLTMGEIFAKAFSGLTYGDGAELIDPSHPRKDGGTAQSNTFTDAVQRPLGYDELILLQDSFHNLKSNKGFPVDVGMGKMTLMIPPKLREVGFQLTGAKGEPDIVGNNINYWEGNDLGLIINPYMSWQYASFRNWTSLAQTDSGNYWDSMYFLMDQEAAKRCLVFRSVSDIRRETWYDEDSENEYARVSDDFGVGVRGWQGIAGSKGDGSTLT